MKSIGSLSFQNGYLDESRTPSWLFTMSQPLLNIRLPTYLPLAHLPLTPEGVLANTFVGKNLKGLGSSGVARHYCRNRCLLSFPQGTKMFQFPWLPLPTLYIQVRVIRHDSNRVSPFGNLRFKACLAAPRSLSQLTTSFIGILRQGIPCVRLSNFLRFETNRSSSLKVQLTSYWQYQ